MLNNDYLRKILEALVAQGSVDGRTYYNSDKEPTTSVTLENKTPYLVLFKKMPNLEGQGGEEISLRGYERLPLNNPSIQGTPFFTKVPQEDVNTKEISITNTSPIQMHSIDENENRTQEILGFGIVGSSYKLIDKRPVNFYSAPQLYYKIENDKYVPATETDIWTLNTYYNKTSTLIAWGRLQDQYGHLVKSEEEASPAEGTAPKLTGGSVPIFDPGTLTLAFNNSEGGLEKELQENLLKMIVNYHNGSRYTDEITFNSYYPKIALFTKNLEGKLEELQNIAGYTRKNLYGYTPTVTEGDINGLQFKNSASIEGTTGSVDNPGEAYVKIQNTNEIQMSAITDDNIDENGIKVYGFGIYAQKVLNNASSDRLIAWGPLVDIYDNAVNDSTAPTLKTGSVPIFYKDKFKMLLGGENTETYVTLDKMELDLYKLLREKPADWPENEDEPENEYYRNYYTKENLKFSPNKSSKWASETYYEKVNVPSYELIENSEDFDITQYPYKLENGKYVPATQGDTWASGTYYNKTSNNTRDITAEDIDDLYYLGVDFKPNTYMGQPTFSSNSTVFTVDKTGKIEYDKSDNTVEGTFTATLHGKKANIGTLAYSHRNPTDQDIQLNQISFGRSTPGTQEKIINISFKDAYNFTTAEQQSLKYVGVKNSSNVTGVYNKTYEIQYDYGTLQIEPVDNNEAEIKVTFTREGSSSIPYNVTQLGTLNIKCKCNAIPGGVVIEDYQIKVG